ncbi:hypothetical protein RI367_007508 [Sorochytrium milnesiophthora]
MSASDTTVYDIPDLAVSLCVIGMQLYNIRCALRCLELVPFFVSSQFKSLGKWILGVHVLAYAFGVLCGTAGVAMASMRLAQSDQAPTTRATLINISNFCSLMQTYAHAIVVIQRLHMVNAYIFSNESIDCWLLFRLRWPELLATAAAVAVGVVEYVDFDMPGAYIAAIVALLALTVLDVTISFVTFNKVHKMLNTRQTVFQWFWSGLWPPSTASGTSATAARARIRSQSTGKQSLSSAQDPRSTTAVVRSWVLVLTSILLTGLVYFLAWQFGRDSDLFIPLLHVTMIFAAVWQRGCLAYIEAIKQVAKQNRVSKQYLGAVTQSGIKALSRWLLYAYYASFTFGALGGLLSVVNDSMLMAGQDQSNVRAAFGLATGLALLLQMYFEAIVAIQRVHMVNAYMVDSEAITLDEILRKRWGEIVYTISGVAMIIAQFVPMSTDLNNLLLFIWLLAVIFMDLGVSVVTLNKVHRMLNTQKTAVSWAFDTLRRLIFGLSSVLFTNDRYLSGIANSVAWILGSLWQRGGLFYIEAIKHVALQNRASKQYLGTVSNTGIKLDTRASAPMSSTSPSS